MEPKRLRYSLFIGVLCVFTVFEAHSQSFYRIRRDRTWMFSYGLGSATYYGDLHEWLDNTPTITRLSYGTGLRKRLSSQFSLRVDLNYYHIRGDDAATWGAKNPGKKRPSGARSGLRDSRYRRNLSFLAKNWELSTMIIIDLVDIKGTYRGRYWLRPYLFIGLGLTTNNPKAIHPITGEKVNLRRLNTEAKPEIQPGILVAFPFGAGVRLKANEFIDIMLEGGLRYVNNDYLDDVSDVYPTLAALENASRKRQEDFEKAAIFYNRSGELGLADAIPGNERGNPEKNDSYLLLQIRLEMYLPYEWHKRLFKFGKDFWTRN